MSAKKQFGVWMDSQHATIIEKDADVQNTFRVVGHVKAETDHGNSNEHTANNHEKTLTTRYFKEIAAYMPNVEVLHLTGTGQIQEEFANYLADTPQYKDTQTTNSTSNKMSDELLMAFFSDKLN